MNGKGKSINSPMAATIAVKQALPTYLKEFLRDDVECVLVYTDGSSKQLKDEEFQEEWNFSSELEPNLNLNNESISREGDLTGNPLHIDLDYSIAFSTVSSADAPPNWTVLESNHFPLNINDARDLLNNKYNAKTSLPIFCVCDAKDKEKTFVLGSLHTGNCLKCYLGQITGIFSCNDKQLDLENLRNEHYTYVRVKADYTLYNFIRVYNIHGFPLHETPALEYSNYNGCVYLETSWNIFTKEEPNINDLRMKLSLKVVSGHKESAIHSIWEQLCYLQNYLRILSSTQVNDGDTVISENYLSISDLTSKIQELSWSDLRRKRKTVETLDYNDLREMNILDKFWVLLNKCQNLKDLKSSLSTFFFMVNLDNYGSSSAIMTIRKSLKSNTEYINRLTFAESLKLLVYIGFEKLKEDYFTIVNFYYPIHQGLLEQKWSELHANEDDKGRSLSVGNKCLEINDTSFNVKKMGFLLQLHDVAEMLTFLKHNSENSFQLSSDNFGFVCKEIYERNILNKTCETKEVGMKVKLIEVTCALNPRNNQIYKDKIPISSIYDITSTINNCSIKTVFHISQVPIFPKCIYDYYRTGKYKNVFVMKFYNIYIFK
ncbi:hypothetical protein WA026_008578 [Henosepilachna vigintioctopunctata]|uniref:Protein zwilch n=1 Tax=Henosepilachna vigintioctopunctata TaxID=420089 RepID=A0AAW1UIX7_9CUCU